MSACSIPMIPTMANADKCSPWSTRGRSALLERSMQAQNTERTAVQERREWLANVFKTKRDFKSYRSVETTKGGIVTDRLLWIAQEKRKSLIQFCPNNKDASENIPENFVEDRKRWLDEEIRNVMMHKRRLMSSVRDQFATRALKPIQNHINNCGTSDSARESEFEETTFRSDYEQAMIEGQGFLQNRMSLSLEDDEMAWPIQTISQINQRTPPAISTPPLISFSRATSPHIISSPNSLSASSTSSLADYARHSAQTMARAHFAVVAMTEDEMLQEVLTSASPRSCASHASRSTYSRESFRIVSPKASLWISPRSASSTHNMLSPCERSTRTMSPVPSVGSIQSGESDVESVGIAIPPGKTSYTGNDVSMSSSCPKTDRLSAVRRTERSKPMARGCSCVIL